MRKPLGVAALLLFSTALSSVLGQTDPNVLARYNFEHLNDEGVKDLSGNGNDATAVCDEASWIKIAAGSAIRLKEPSDRVTLPAGAFPGNKGSIKVTVTPSEIDGAVSQVLFRVYGRGDGLTLAIRDGKVTFSYYNRALAKSVATYLPVKELPVGRSSEIIAGWDIGQKLFLSINGDVREIPVSMEADFAEGNTGNLFVLGNDNSWKTPFTGDISAFEISREYPQVSSTQPASSQASSTASAPASSTEITFAPGETCTVHNPALAFTFSKKDGLPVSSSRDSGRNDLPLLAKIHGPADLKLWEIVLAKDFGRGESLVIHPQDSPAPPALDLSPNGDSLTITWAKIPLKGTTDSAAVTVKIDLKTAAPLSSWKIGVQLSSGAAFGVNEVHFPFLSLAPPSAEIEKVRLAVPYRWGQLLPDPFRAAQQNSSGSYAAQYIYPTANMSMQFFAYYGPEHTGTYVATYDSKGYVKQYSLNTVPSRKRVELMVINYPHDRSATSYQLPYPVIVGNFHGDWYDASQLYRRWATAQPWCAKGGVASRDDIPAWIKNSDLAIRMHTKDGRPTENNLYGALQLSKDFGGPILSNWYAWWQPDLARTITSKSGGYANAWGARTSAMRPGNVEALKQLADAGVYSCAYINTVTYDQGAVPDAEAALLQNSVTIDKSGQRMIYDPKALPMWLMSRNSPKWQDYYANLSAEVIKLGFAGIYMDSFGRSSIFSYAPEATAPIAAGDGPSIGQLEMGAKVRRAIRQVNKDAIMVGEAASEQFIAMIDANLLHMNVMSDACPLWMSVYHDYQILFGRSFGTGQDTTDQSFRQRMGNLFTLGVIPGRVFVEGSSVQKAEAFPFRPNEAAQLDFLRRVVAFRKKDREFLAFGQMLRPATISPPPALATTDAEKASVPEILTSTWKDSTGRVALIVVNSSSEPRNITLQFDTGDYGFDPQESVSLVRQGLDTVDTAAQLVHGNSRLECALSGGDIAVYILSKAPAKG